ncbi:MAG: hypothetical protein HYT14_00450 [Candidatus Liptonbacteria bacterium]|nr:hypothetical protein [Candidatus Liptonbacteria bacterium]
MDGKERNKWSKSSKAALWALALFLPMEAIIGLFAGLFGFSLKNYQPVMSFVLSYVIVWIFITLRENRTKVEER